MRTQKLWGRLGLGLGILALALVLAALALFLANKDGVPVLNYHQINDTEKNVLTVNTMQFEAQMKYLADEGYTAITPQEMLDAWENGTPLPEKPVVITFDDGYRDNYNHAFPILEKYHLKATVFLITDYVGTYPNYMTWAQVAEMQGSGYIDFESHTLSHEELLKAPTLAEAEHQLRGSKHAIEYNTGHEVKFIAYPCGTYDADIERLTKEAGYRAAFTVTYGLATPKEDPFILDRIPVFGSLSHTFARFKARLIFAPVLAPLVNFKTNLGKSHPEVARHIPLP